MKRRWWIWVLGAVVALGLGGGVIWFVSVWNQGAGNPLPSHHSAAVALGHASEGLKSQNEALFLSSVDSDKPSALRAWKRCSVAFTQHYDVYVTNDVGENNTSVIVDGAGGTQVCAIAMEWTPKSGWTMSSSGSS